MKLKSIIINEWRKIDSIEIQELSDAVNLVAGPNEAGKSTVFEAVRFALFESHKGKAQYKEAIRPSRGGTPQVDLAFDVDGKNYRIQKQFLTKPSAILSGDSIGRLNGQEAENKLCEILGLDAQGGRTALGNDQMGMWPLLWVQQGRSTSPPSDDLNDGTRNSLQATLGDEVADLATGDRSNALLERVEREYARFWTKTGQISSGGELGQVQSQLENARNSHQTIVKKRESIDHTIDDLRSAEAAEKNIQPRLEKLNKELANAREGQQKVDGLKNELTSAKTAFITAQAACEAADNKLAARKKLAQEISDLDESLGKLAKENAGIQDDIERKRESLEAAKTAVTDGEKAVEKIQGIAQKAKESSRRSQLESTLSTQKESLAKAEEQQKLMDDANQLLSNLKINKESLKKIEELQHQLENVTAQLRGASARIRVEAVQDVVVDGEKLPGKQSVERTFDNDGELDIENIAHIKVMPGGTGGLRKLREKKADVQQALTQSLQAAGVEDPRAAHKAFQKVQEAEQQRKQATALIESFAPAGLDSLRADVKKLTDNLKNLPDIPDNLPPEKQAEEELNKARQTLDAARKKRDQLQEELNGFQIRAERLSTQQENVSESLTAKQAEAQALPKEDVLAANHREALGRRDNAKARVDELKEQISQAGGETLGSDIKRLEKAVSNLVTERDRLSGQIAAHRKALGEHRGESLHEQLQEAATEVGRLEREYERVKAIAEAIKLLHEKLLDARREARVRYVEPVIEQVKPFLTTIFEDRNLELSEDWQITGVRTADEQLEHFDWLSGGAKEQLSILVRLGLAKVLAGESTLPVILDDALVSSDADRLRRMIQALGRAANGLQLIIFTCHPEAYDAVGADVTIRLKEGGLA